MACLAAMMAFRDASAAPIDPKLYAGLVWRNIGPFRGGRVSAVSGAVGQPGVFYAGFALGGLWKTTGAGTTWQPVMDSIRDSSCVGAVEVAPSDPNVVYVGMGDQVAGGGIAEGDGVYKSTDAGKTWQHVGLEDTKQIPSILVDPKDPDIVMVAAQGNLHQRSASRGIFRSTDGGKTWKKTLYLDDATGVQKLAWDPANPSVILATTDRHYYASGTGRGRNAAPDTSGVVSKGTAFFKSTDEGLTWKELKGGGIPNLGGRTCVAIAAHTHSQRMFLVGNSGLYRSDDGGTTWRQMDAADPRVRNGQGGYNCGVYVSSGNPDLVYVINTSSYVSSDGGNTFTGFKGAPGGDDPQQMWIDPANPLRLLLGTDQGATVSLDGGLTWSSWYNQPTAQVYHISVDNSYPYWVYATQQDSGAVATRSRGDLGEITPLDWLPTPAYEFGSIVADPLNPNIIYGGGESGFVKITYPSAQWIEVSPNVDPTLTLRRVGNQPLIYSRTNPHELFTGYQFLMSTTDGGKHWRKLSPDLGYAKGAAPPAPAKPAPKKAGAKGTVVPETESDMVEESPEEAEMNGDDEQGPGASGGSIESISPSSVDGGVIWVGSNNGLVKVTRDHGRHWDDVSIPNLPNGTRSDISAIDASHQDPATAYAAVDCHNVGDYAPYFYRTHDFGKTWTKIVKGLPTGEPIGSFARVIRADTIRPGLLFAGTETSMYVSLNDGDDWQPLRLNLPATSYRDAVVKDNDLVVGTYGRSFWVLDDISPLRQIAEATQAEQTHLFKPADAIRVRRNVNEDTPFPPEVPHALNPPVGAIVYYYLASAPASPVTLDIRSASGKLVRHMSSAPIVQGQEPLPPEPDFWIAKPKPMPVEVGTNRINWDLRYDSPPTFFHDYQINANPGETPPSPQGPLVAPGVYTLTLTVDGKALSQTVTVKNDPRSPASAGDLRAQCAMQAKLYDNVVSAWGAIQVVTDVRAAVANAAKQNGAADLAKAASDLDDALGAIGGRSPNPRFGGFSGFGGAHPSSFVGVHGLLLRRLNTLDTGDMAPNAPMTSAYRGAIVDANKVIKSWNQLLSKDMPAFNVLLSKYKIKQVVLPAPMTEIR